MTLQELQRQVLALDVGDRLILIQSVIQSLQQEISPAPILSQETTPEWVKDLHPLTQSLIGIVPVQDEPTESSVDYLEEKYR